MLRFLVNPASGGGRARRHLGRIRRRAETLEGVVEVSRNAADLVARARQAVADGVPRLVVAGGDGTMHLTIQELAASRCELALLPIGRGNDLAASLGIPRRFDEALDLACGGAVQAIDLGRAGDRWFHSYGGAGFDSAVSVTADHHPRWWPDRLTYVIAVLRTLIGFRPPTARVTWDGGSFAGPVMFVTACNAPLLGGGMKMAPAADLRDGLLDLVIVRRVTKPALLRVFPQVYRGTHVDHPALSFHRTRKATLELEPPMPLGCDGELAGKVGSKPLQLSVQPSALRVVRPPASAGR